MIFLGVIMCIYRRITGPTRRSKKGGWTEEEDKILVIAIKKCDGKNWKKVDVQCLRCWQKVLNPNLEDDLIMELVEQQGNKKWSQIASHLPGCIGKQCRKRWHNHLNRNINKTPWTKEEVLALIEAYKIVHGNKRTKIAKLLPGSTENAIKNHWICLVKRRVNLHVARGSDPNNDKTIVEGTIRRIELKRNRVKRMFKPSWIVLKMKAISWS